MIKLKDILKESIDGKVVANHIKSITPSSGNIPNYFIKKYILPNSDWYNKTIDPKSLLRTDKDFVEYFRGGEERYDQDEMNKYDLELELVIYKGTLLDGYSRAAYMIRNKIKKAYTYSHD